MINGNRLRQAREMMCLTQAQLAKAVGVTQGAIAHFESGVACPRDETLEAIALRTGFRVAFFTEPPSDADEFPAGSLLFRARSATSARARESARRHAHTLYQAVVVLAKRVKQVPVKIPRLAGDPTRAAQVTRAALGLAPDRPIESLIRSLERGGIIVFPVRGLPDDIDAFSLWVSGPSEPTPIITINVNCPTDRLRFSVAHELGHLVLHQGPTEARREVERAADMFGAEFLMPGDALRVELSAPVTITLLTKLKARWRTSMAALVRRARDLDCIGTARYRSLNIELRARWGTNEPVALTEERPRAMRKMAEVFFGNVLTPEKLAGVMSWTPQLARTVLGAFAPAPTIPPRAVAMPAARGDVLRFPHSRSTTKRRDEA